MRATNDNAPTKTIEQAKSEFIDNVRTAIEGINALTENLERMRATLDEKRRSVQ